MDFGWLGIGECAQSRVPSDNTQRMDCCASRSNPLQLCVPWAELQGGATPPPVALQSQGGGHSQDLYMGPSGARRGFGMVPMLPSQISKAGEQQSARLAKAPSNPQGEPIHSIPTQLDKTPQVLHSVDKLSQCALYREKLESSCPSCAHLSAWLCMPAIHRDMRLSVRRIFRPHGRPTAPVRAPCPVQYPTWYTPCPIS